MAKDVIDSIAVLYAATAESGEFRTIRAAVGETLRRKRIDPESFHGFVGK